MFFTRKQTSMVDADSALPGRETEMPLPAKHEVLGTPLKGPFPEGVETAIFGMGCFWGAERIFWEAQGVYTTAVGYAGGLTPNPTYEEVCSGRTGHTEAVLVAFHAEQTSYEEMLKLFWEGHDPTQGMRQGNDVGTQYRSAILWHGEAQRQRRRVLARGLPGDAHAGRATARSPPRSPRRARSTTPRTTTSSTWPRTPTATAASAAPASAARSASPLPEAPGCQIPRGIPGAPGFGLRSGPCLTARPRRSGAAIRRLRPIRPRARPRGWPRPGSQASRPTRPTALGWAATPAARAGRRALERPMGRPRCRGSRDRRSPAPRRRAAAARRSRRSSAG